MNVASRPRLLLGTSSAEKESCRSQEFKSRNEVEYSRTNEPSKASVDIPSTAETRIGVEFVRWIEFCAKHFQYSHQRPVWAM